MLLVDVCLPVSVFFGVCVCVFVSFLEAQTKLAVIVANACVVNVSANHR